MHMPLAIDSDIANEKWKMENDKWKILFAPTPAKEIPRLDGTGRNACPTYNKLRSPSSIPIWGSQPSCSRIFVMSET
jgi:hypothetical protein